MPTLNESPPNRGDETANKLAPCNILKVIATGGSDRRRVLYTTSTMQETPYQARLWLTMNTGDPNEETVGSRMIIIDAAERATTAINRRMPLSFMTVPLLSLEPAGCLVKFSCAALKAQRVYTDLRHGAVNDRRELVLHDQVLLLGDRSPLLSTR